MFFENFDEFKQFFLDTDSIFLPKKIAISQHAYELKFDNSQIQNVFESKSIHAAYVSTNTNIIGIKWDFNGSTISPCSTAELDVTILVNENQQQIIGDTVEVKFSYFTNSKSVRGKVDTGADVCSLHVSKWNSSGNRVSFIAPNISNNTITANQIDNQAVKSADGGIEYRPVVEFDITINGKELRKIAFNLNDRSQMEFPILIGQNALEQGKFLVNPSANEGIDWHMIKQMMSD